MTPSVVFLRVLRVQKLPKHRVIIRRRNPEFRSEYYKHLYKSSPTPHPFLK